MFGSASQGDEQADQLYFGMLVSLIAFLWSAAEYLHLNKLQLLCIASLLYNEYHLLLHIHNKASCFFKNHPTTR